MSSANANGATNGVADRHAAEHSSHGHHHHHHHHHHDDHNHYPDSWTTRLMQRVGLVQLAERMEHAWVASLVSLACFFLALVVQLPLISQLLSERVAGVLHSLALGGTYFVSGIPQAVSSVAIAGSGQLDTHVLMSLAVLATLYLGMAQEVRSARFPPRSHLFSHLFLQPPTSRSASDHVTRSICSRSDFA